MLILLTILNIILISTGYPIDQNEKWVVPEEDRVRINPLDINEDLATGKSLYQQHCRSCHGKSGIGDGPQARQLELSLVDFTTEDFQAQSDGSLFYKISNGRGLMPEFKKKVEYEEDRWLIVNYIRSLGE